MYWATMTRLGEWVASTGILGHLLILSVLVFIFLLGMYAGCPSEKECQCEDHGCAVCDPMGHYMGRNE